MENEVFTEAVPTTFIMTFLMVVLVFTREDEEARILAGETLLPISGRFLFFATFSTSALSAGLGLAKCLKVRYSPIPERYHAEILMDGNHFDKKIVSLQ